MLTYNRLRLVWTCIRLTHQSVQLLLFSLHLLQEAINVLLIVVQLEQLLLKLAVHLHTEQKRYTQI